MPAWHLIDATSNAPRNESGQPIALPTVDRTVVQQTDGVAGQIVTGGNLDITAATLSNQGGIVSAARNVTLNVGTLDNSRSATLVNIVTDTVNQSELDAFLARLKALGEVDPHTGVKTLYSQLMYGTIPPSCEGDSCGAPPMTAAALNVGVNTNGAAVVAPTQTTVTHQLGKAGQITAGGSLALNGTGDLTNAGDIAAAGNIKITTPGTFTNKGVHEVNVTTVQGCVPGGDCPDDSAPTVQSVAWKQTPSTIAAGNTLTIEAGNVQNLSATLAAQGTVGITTAGTVTNQAGVIQSVSGDVSITAASLVNKSLDPVKLHKSYGGQNPSYAGGCNPGGTYGNSQCSATEDAAAGPAAVISAARDVTIQTGSVSNNGALITGGRNVNVQASGGVDNTAIALNADWVGRWQENRSGGDRWHDTGGRATIGNIASGIQAGNALTVNAGGQIVNTGNLLGAGVDLTGASLVNGITSPDQPTPPAATPRQVISLGPAPVPAGSLPATTPAADPTQPWQFTPVIVATPSAPTTGTAPSVDWHFNAKPSGTPITTPGGGAQYVNPSAATAVLAGVTPDSLLAQLPPELRPGNVSFYYDPYTESQQLQQAALAQTGQQSFINGLAWDSQNNLSVNDQQKLALYNNAADYAKANHIALGQALTDDQVKALDAPMLWYVEQAVPDPRCTAASSVCPSVNALVPQVYLPEGYAQALSLPTGGTISGDNIKIAVDGQLRNTGQVVANDTLTVKAGSIDLSPNVVSIGTNAYKAQGGWNVVTGTVVQPGGFLSAMHMDIEADSIRAINDAFRITRADGSVDADASAALVAQLKESLGLNYVEGTVADDIHTQFIKEKKGLGILGQIIAMAAAVAISIMTAGSGAALLAVVAGNAFATSAIGAAIAAGLSGLVAGTLSSMVTQIITTGTLNIGAALKAGAVSGLTAGLTHGAMGALNVNNAGINSLGDNLAKGDWTQAAGQLGNYAQATVVRSVISAGISTAVYGGSFGQAFAGGLVRDAAALAANAAGVKLPGIGTENATTDSIIANAAAHALIGCAAQSLNGGDCAGGAIGGAVSALTAPLIRDAIYAGTDVVSYSKDEIRQGITVGLSTLIGGSIGALLGTDATSAALAAQNEALNNATSHGPARGIAARENARLMAACGSSCTQEDFNRIDTQVRQVEAAAMLAKMNNLTPEQALKLADMLSNLLPYYGSAAMLYQAVTGKTLSGQELGTADRWLSGILGAIPIGAAAYGRITEFVKTWAVLDGAGGAASIPRTIPYQPPGSVVLQGNAPVCGPACAAMVIGDKTGTSINLQEAIGSFANGIRPTGVNATELSSVISNAGVRNTVETALLPRQLDNALSNGQAVIVNVGGHFVIVDSKTTVNGTSYYMTRDPYTGPRGVLASALESVMSQGVNAIVIGR
ncbi:hypothetical protein LMG32289_02162 [Cupriavidus pampae]|uniref:DUF637 domain-containing protein n=1 Tax=Cupriavidus pampae TaxID=659251 RepID=A0ABM8WTL1_9BURK|nr:hypothetical protein LMG32289_02162 [Cupriavidus pampae]